MIERDTIWKHKKGDLFLLIGRKYLCLWDSGTPLIEVYECLVKEKVDQLWRSRQNFELNAPTEEYIRENFKYTGNKEIPENNKVENIIEKFEPNRLLGISND